MITATLAVLLIAVLTFIYFDRQRADARESKKEQAWERERSSLLNRIQHPEVVQYPPEQRDELGPLAEALEFPEGDEIDRVGSIYGGDGGDDGD